EPDAAPGSDRRSMQRIVRKDGCATILGTHFQMGKEHIGATVHVIYDDATIMFFGPQGTEIISHPRPPGGTPYVGNGKPSGIAADPAGARRKRISYPRRTDTRTTTPHELSTKP
ncbi:hypothetical protein ACX80S_15390, partial [Arthrobacter sp. RHLT1-20]